MNFLLYVCINYKNSAFLEGHLHAVSGAGNPDRSSLQLWSCAYQGMRRIGIIPNHPFQNLSAVFHSGKFLPSKLRMEVLVRRAAKGLPSQRVLINFISPSAKLYGKISRQSPALGCFELWNMLNMFEGSEHVKLLKHARNRPDYMVRHAEMRLRLRGLDRQ